MSNGLQLPYQGTLNALENGFVITIDNGVPIPLGVTISAISGINGGVTPPEFAGTPIGVSGEADSGIGVQGISSTDIGVHGQSASFDAIVGETQSDTHAGVTGRNFTSGVNGGVGIYGTGGQYAGKFDGALIGAHGAGSAAQGGIGVQGIAYTGVVGLAGGQSLQGTNPAAGVYGVGPVGIYGQSPDNGVVGSSPQTGVEGETTGSDGNGTSGIGVSGRGSMHGIGVLGSVGANGSSNTTGIAILGQASGTGGGLAGKFEGNVDVVGTLTKQAGGFKIDHPLDPENRELQHSFVESPDMMNIYNGIVILDGCGEAIINLPDWFEALNGDFRYQLTCIGQFAPVYIAEKISKQHFKISGGDPFMEISWQVTGIRRDSYAQEHRIATEVAKPTQHPSGLVFNRALAA